MTPLNDWLPADQPRDHDRQGKREDQVSFSELVAGICLGVALIAVIAAYLLDR